MLGNDIVDLRDSETRDGPSHAGFDARVFAASERAMLAASATPNRLRWTLWAAKEAAYKLGVKRTPELIFSPRRFVVQLRDERNAGVVYPGGEVEVALRDDGEFVHAIATERNARRVVSGMARAEIGADSSAQVRQLAREQVATHLGVDPGMLRIGRRGRVPTLEKRDGKRSFDLSLSHHGRYLAFACEIGGAAR